MFDAPTPQRKHPGWDIAHVITCLELGGAQLATLYQVEQSRWGDGARYLICGPGGLLEDEARRLKNVQLIIEPSIVRPIQPWQDLRAVWRLIQLFRKMKQSGRRLLVHTHSSKAGVLGRIAAKLSNSDCIIHSIHGFGHQAINNPWARRLSYWAERAVGRFTDGITADSKANIQQALRESILLPTQPHTVVYCGTALENFRPRGINTQPLRQTLGLAASDDVVLNISCLKPQKDLITFVNAAAAIFARRPNTQFLIAGDGVERQRIEALIREKNLGQRVHLLGWRRDIPDLLELSNLLVLTSRWEGLPQTLAQAMAAGKPVVATHVDGTAEAVLHNETGFLCTVGHVSEIAEAVVKLLEEPHLQETFSKNARAHVQQFSQEKMVQDLDTFYAEVTSTSRL